MGAMAPTTRGRACISGCSGSPPRSMEWCLALSSLTLGFTPDAIKHRLARGRLIRIHRGVYAIGHDRLSRRGRWMAAVLTCGPGAVLSHRSAAAHWGLLDTHATRIDVSLPSHRAVRAREAVRIHRVRLGEPDRSLRDAIPITTPMRTLLDLGDVVSPSRVREAYEQSLRLGLFDLNEIDALIARSTGRRGLKPIKQLLAEGQDEPPILRSELERRFLDLCRDQALPLPRPPTRSSQGSRWTPLAEPAPGGRARRLRDHRRRVAFERDRERDAAARAGGLPRLAIHRQAAERATRDGIAATVRAMLGA